MKTLARLAALAAAFAFVRPALGQEIQWLQSSQNSHWYGVPVMTTPWSGGEALAVQLGGHLATIRSSAEQLWVQTNLGVYAPSAGLWIGLNDAAVEGTFVWSSGEPLGYTNWNSGQPDNLGGVEDWVLMSASFAWKWDDDVDTAFPVRALVERSTAPLAGWSFAEHSTTQSAPQTCAVGDFDGDGRDDVIVPNRSSNSLSLFFGLPSGVLSAATNIPCPAGPIALFVGHFDDGPTLDVAVACYDAQEVHVFFGNGAGAFPTSVSIPLGAHPLDLVAAQLDGDGRLDIAVTTGDGSDRLRILKSSGSGTFQPQVVYATGSRPIAVTAGDLNGDGHVDLVVSNTDSNDLSIYLNQGDGSFVQGALFARGNRPGHGVLADFNGDGNLDLAIPLRLDNTVRVMWGQGDGTFDTSGPLFSVGVQPAWVTAKDVDGNGKLDLLVANFGGNSVTLIHGGGPGAFTTSTELFAGTGASCVTTANVGGDARPEIVIAATTANQLVLLRNLTRDCNGNGVDDPADISVGTSLDCNANGIPDECDLAQGATFDCDGNHAIDSCEIAANAQLDLNHNGTLDQCESAGTGFCFGDGTGAACPCDPGQAGAPGGGCQNSFAVGGRLIAVGNPSVAADSVSLRASGLLPGAIGLFFQGNVQQNAGLGTPLGDGLLCVNQGVVRLVIRSASGGTMAFGRDVASDPPISVKGHVPAAGATRFYQLWYRDAAPFCTTATFNLTNGVRVVWQS